MSRSKWKGPFLKSELKYKKLTLKNLNIVSRNSKILPKFQEITWHIHNGQTYTEILVTEDMVGHKFGEFSLTRKNFSYKKKKKKK